METELYQVATSAISIMEAMQTPKPLKGKSSFFVQKDQPMVLRWSQIDMDRLPTYVRCRLTTASRSYGSSLIEAYLPDSNTPLRMFDIRRAQDGQIFEITLEREEVEQIREQGLGLRLVKGEGSLHFDGPGSTHAVFMPHLLNATDQTPQELFYERIVEFSSQDVDLLTQRLVRQAVNDLCVAKVITPDHMLPWMGPENARTHNYIDAEDSYTRAFALTQATREGNSDAAEQALQMLKEHQQLWQGEDFYGRYQNGEGSFKNHAFPLALHFLGTVRTLIELPTEQRPTEIVSDVQRMAEVILEAQTMSGLWTVLIDDLDTSVDTATTAGMAAGLALASKHGLLGGLRPVSEISKAATALRGFLTPDGLLTGAAQPDECDECSVREDYHVISGLGMGLFGQLLAVSRVYRS